ncbi:hypothetical protein MHB50_09815 [Siminovitchia sp. FSL H7-0308]|uniref:Uncharacterized protein n=1 Tax=Siminovitchia thermophila TaxID=1245522 RepID=A0ABS2R9W9_9BACI|nr:hypothetical protein [Siminovitchia thermophila]MBM7716441.1 hypothetical protein [Siminovitchia thermophila]
MGSNRPKEVSGSDIIVRRATAAFARLERVAGQGVQVHGEVTRMRRFEPAAGQGWQYPLCPQGGWMYKLGIRP